MDIFHVIAVLMLSLPSSFVQSHASNAVQRLEEAVHDIINATNDIFDPGKFEAQRQRLLLIGSRLEDKMKELKAEFRNESSNKLKKELKSEMKTELKSELKTELKTELGNKLKTDLWKKLTTELRNDQDEMKAEISLFKDTCTWPFRRTKVGLCIFRPDRKLKFESAISICRRSNSSLATVKSEEELKDLLHISFIESLLGTSTYCHWIGIRSKSGKLNFLGPPENRFVTSNMGAQSSEKCVKICETGMEFTSCNDVRFFICKKNV